MSSQQSASYVFSSSTWRQRWRFGLAGDWPCLNCDALNKRARGNRRRNPFSTSAQIAARLLSLAFYIWYGAMHRALLVATDSDRRTCESLSHTGYGSRVVWFGRACSWAGLFVADGWKHLKACPFVNPQTLFFWKPKKNRKLRDFPCIFLLLL